MDFSDTTNKNGLIQRCEQILFGDNGFGKISGNANLLAMFTNFGNEALDWYATTAIKHDNDWRYDGTNSTTLMDAYTDLVANQRDYTLSTSFLTLKYAEALDPTGTVWIPLTVVSEDEIKASGMSFGQYAKTAGVPSQYMKQGNSLIMLPASSYDMTEGLKLGIQRGNSYFAVTDTTKTAGIPSTHDRFIYDYMSWLYARDRDAAKAVSLEKRVIQYEREDIPEHYGKHGRDEQRIIRSVTRTKR
jgi:hypothetical protein